MPTITFTVSVAQGTEITNCFGAGYQDTIDGQPNPETKTQYARKQIIVLLKENVLLYRRREAAALAVTTDPDIT
jgi:hypothetical protein